MARGLGARTVLAPAGDPGEDQPRVDGGTLGGPDTEPLTGARTETVQQHISFGGVQLEQHLRPALHVQIDDAFTAMQQVDVLGGHGQPARPGDPYSSLPESYSPFFTFSTCLRKPSVAVSIPPFMVRLMTNPGSGTERSIDMSNFTVVFSPLGVNV
ncbi:hypothetical protein BH11ACT6_BH11ACT6_34270 [soil metagenome]